MNLMLWGSACNEFELDGGSMVTILELWLFWFCSSTLEYWTGVIFLFLDDLTTTLSDLGFDLAKLCLKSAYSVYASDSGFCCCFL
jgi:hypothetical protein